MYSKLPFTIEKAGFAFSVAQGRTAWKGILVKGTAEIENTTIANAERGLVILPGSNVTVKESAFIACRIGIHASGRVLVAETRFEESEWYGVKEDAITGDARPALIECVFKANGNNYYHTALRLINIETLNTLGTNSGNREEN